MDDGISQDTADLYGEIMAQRFILENLWARILANDPDPDNASRSTGEEMCRQFELAYNDPVSAGEDQIIQHGLARLERFWAHVADRLSTRER